MPKVRKEAKGAFQAYRFALDPTPKQEQALRSHAGASRVAYNYLLGRIKANLDQRSAEATYGIAEADRTPYLNVSHYSLRKLWNENKADVAPWWAQNSKETYSSAAQNLAASMKNFFDSRKGARAGRKSGFPRFKKKRTQPGFTFTTGAIRVEPSRHHVALPVLGTIKTHESTRKLARRIEAGTARITSATIREEGGRWFVSFTADVQRNIPKTRKPNRIIGVDLGVKTLYVGATPSGEQCLEVANPKHLQQAESKLRRAQRKMARKQGPDRRTGQEPSGRYLKEQRRVTKLHRRVANRRKDLVHKTTTHLAKNYDVVAIESLNVTGMVKNRRLAKAVSDASFGEFARQLKYKTEWYGSKLVPADQFFPSSKKCSGCPAVKAKLLLSEREYVCSNCGIIVDRDLNAAINLARYGASYPAGSVSVAGRGGKQKTRKAARRPGKAAVVEASTSRVK
jgi:IS605 OrfB family transposase